MMNICQLLLLCMVLSLVLAQYHNEKSEESSETVKKGKDTETESESQTQSEEESSEEEVIDPKHYDEVWATDYKGHVYLAAALYGDKDWKSWKVDHGHELYQPGGVTVCGEPDQWGRWKYLYVADEGDASHPGAVHRYNINRKPGKHGEATLSAHRVIYGGEEKIGMDLWKKEAPAAEEEGKKDLLGGNNAKAEAKPTAPTDVACSHEQGGVFITDKNHGQVQYNPKGSSKTNTNWVDNDCGKAPHGAEAAKQAGDWVYWATHNNAEDASSNGIYRQKVDNGAVDCQAAPAKDDWLKEGGDVEKWSAAGEDGAWGVAVHNEKVLVAQKGSVWEAAEPHGDHEDWDEWATGFKQVRKIASAWDRGVAVADEASDHVYIAQGGDKYVEIAEVPNAYGLDYYAGVDGWKKGEAEEEAASHVAIGAAAAIAAAAAATL